MLSDDDCGSIFPQKKSGNSKVSSFKEVLFDGQVKVYVVALGVEDSDGGFFDRESS